MCSLPQASLNCIRLRARACLRSLHRFQVAAVPAPLRHRPAGTTAGQDLNLSLDRVNSNRNFTNKLWNAGKFILFQLEGVSDAEWQQLSGADFSSSSSWQGLSLSDRWVLSSLHQVRSMAVVFAAV